MRKVVHIITGLQNGGAEAVLFRLCRNDNINKHTVISLTDDGKYGPLLQQMGIKVYFLHMKSGRLSLSSLFKLYKLLRSIRPEVVQTWMYHADLIGGLVAKFARVPNVYWGVHHSTLEKGASKRSTIFIARFCALLSKWIPKQIICCAQKALIIHNRLGYASDKLTVINNGYELEQFAPSQGARETLRKNFDVENDVFLLGLVGRFNPQKDHFNLLEALSLVKMQHADIKCVLVGSDLNSSNKELTARIFALGLQDVVLLLDQRLDIPDVMNALDLHILSSNSEGFPNVLAEAMACGTPCVTTDVGDASLIVGTTGWVVPVRDPRALSQAILEALEEKEHLPDKWAERQRQCREHIVKNFSIGKMIQQYHRVWNKG